VPSNSLNGSHDQNGRRLRVIELLRQEGDPPLPAARDQHGIPGKYGRELLFFWIHIPRPLPFTGYAGYTYSANLVYIFKLFYLHAEDDYIHRPRFGS
jgi:hypothetical protein